MDRRHFLTAMLAAGAFPIGHASAGESSSPFPVLKAAGLPRELGLAHGKAFAKQIKHNLNFYFSWLGGDSKIKPARLIEMAEEFIPVVKKYLPNLMQEIEGIAQGAALSPEEIMMINARTDILAKIKQRKINRTVPGCTGLAVHGGSPPRPLLALGQTWDWRADLFDSTVILRLKPTRGPELVTLTEAGMVGKIGFNQHRLGVCLNFLSHASDSLEPGVGLPVHVLLRAVMDCTDLEEAFKLICWVPRCASANFLLAQAAKTGNQILNLEWTPNSVARIRRDDGHLVHTNHFITPELALSAANDNNASSLSRFQSANRITRQLNPEDPAEVIKKVLRSRENAPLCISRKPEKGMSGLTVAGVVMDLSRNRLWLTRGAPHLSKWTQRPGVS